MREKKQKTKKKQIADACIFLSMLKSVKVRDIMRRFMPKKSL